MSGWANREPNQMRRRIALFVVVSLMILWGGIVLARGAVESGSQHPHAAASKILLGDPRIEKGRQKLLTGRIRAFRLRATGSGDARWIGVYLDSRSRATGMRVAIYKDSAGAPGGLLTSATTRAVAGGAWNWTRVRAAKLRRGSPYWVAVGSVRGALVYRVRSNGSCVSKEGAHNKLAAGPRLWSHATFHACPLSAFVTSVPPGKLHAPTGPVNTNPTGPTGPGGSTTNPGGSTGPGNQTGCVSHPSACGYPDATNTGVPAGTNLIPISQAALPAGATWNGSMLTITGDNVTIDGLRVPGAIAVYGDGATIENTMVQDPSGQQAILVHTGATGAVIKNSTIAGMSPTSPESDGIQGNNLTAVGNYIYWTVEDVNGGGDIVENSYLVSDGSVPGGHNEPVEVDDGNWDPALVQHNTLLNPLDQTAAIIVGGPWGPLKNVTITDNLMAGGDYTLYCCQTDAWGVDTPPSNTSITNNRFSREYFPKGGLYGPLADLNTTYTKFTGNVWDDSLAPLAP